MAVRKILCKGAASRSGLPGLDWALNPYRGCGHACSYCYAQDVTRFEMNRPWGEDIEVKVNFVEALRKQLGRRPTGTFGLGTVTDPYQSVEREYELSRGSLVELKRLGTPTSILTKSDLVLRDLDILTGWRAAEVGISVGIVDDEMASVLEPRAARPTRRFSALRALSDAGVETYVMAAPIIPGICDSIDSLRTLVRKTVESGVRKIMWDKFNPKPIAGRRLRTALAGLSVQMVHPDDTWTRSVRAALQDECRVADVELLEAF